MQRHQRQGEEHSNTEPQAVCTDGPGEAVAEARDASTQTSRPPSPLAVVDEAADLSSLLLQPHDAIDSPSSWLAWLQLSGFTLSETLFAATAADAADGTPAASTAAATPLPTTASPSASSQVPAASTYAHSSNSTPMPRHHAASAVPAPSLSSSATAMHSKSTATATATAAVNRTDGRLEGEGAVRAGQQTAGVVSGSNGFASSTASMLHLRPSSAVVLALDGLSAPLVDTQRRQYAQLAVSGSSHASRPALLPWMNKHAATSAPNRTHNG